MSLDNVGSKNDNVISTSVILLLLIIMLCTALNNVLKTNITDSGKVITYDLIIVIYEPVIYVYSLLHSCKGRENLANNGPPNSWGFLVHNTKGF